MRKGILIMLGQSTKWQRRHAPTIALALAASLSLVAFPSFANHLNVSDFEGADGNQKTVDGIAGEKLYDWQDFVGSLTPIIDTPVGGGDTSLAGGTKDNTECPDLKTGSIPPNKDNLVRFMAKTEVIGDNIFLYLAYVRIVGSDTASAHGVFELNQSPTLCDEQFTLGKNPNKVTIDSPFHDRIDGDVRILFDYEGGDKPSIGYQTWNDTTQQWSAPEMFSDHEAEGQVNSGDIHDYFVNETLTNRQFAEAKINLTAAELVDPESCKPFAAASLYTGASGNSGNEQSKDVITPATFTEDLCGDLTIEKYIDVDESGTENSGDVTNKAGDSEGDLDGWQFTVTGPDGASDVVCSGSTNDEGVLACTQLATGDYVVTETNAGAALNSGADSFNTDPGNSSVSKTVTVTTSGTTTRFGNACLNEVVFTVNGLPGAGQTGQPTSVTVDWTSTDPNQPSGSKTLTINGTSASGATGHIFETWDNTQSPAVKHTIDWSFYINGDNSTTRQGGDDVAMVGYTSCEVPTSTNYPNVDINGFKFKDANHDGVQSGALETGLGGFTFELRIDDGVLGDDSDDTVVATATSSSNAADLGEYTFQNIYPGTYYVTETGGPDHWVQTAPAVNKVVVTVSLAETGESVSLSDDFGNTPLSRVKIEFEDLTGYTDATIDCDWTTENPDSDPDVDTSGQTEETESVESSELKTGTYICTVVITDP